MPVPPTLRELGTRSSGLPPAPATRSAAIMHSLASTRAATIHSSDARRGGTTLRRPTHFSVFRLDLEIQPVRITLSSVLQRGQAILLPTSIPLLARMRVSLTQRARRILLLAKTPDSPT